ncbi:MAG: diacylglycerol kinase family lipid kinase [Ignavibacteria bacterium]|nr:diacylglycerol kinase family lipid kinase [Ignavibacteria bacterium]
MKVFYINNPAAHGGKGAKYFSLIKNELDKNNISYEAVETKYAGHGTELVNNLDFTKYDALVVSGGDGTLFETINGYFANKSAKRIPIGVIPIGRGNAFARDIDLHPENWKDAVKAVAVGKTKFVDVGLFKTNNKQFYFINILGFGFVTDVAKTAFKLRAMGHLSYILGVLYRTISLKEYKLKMEADGKVYERENVFAEISNTRYTGKDFFMAPAAIIDDGLLDITLLNKLSRIRLLQALPKIFTGDHVKMNEVECFKAKHIKIETEPRKLLTPDGQLMESTPIEIECLPKAIEVFVK